MNPRIESVDDKDGVLRFRLSGVNVSLANGLRRTILSDIETAAFITSPHEQCKMNITSNTTRLNNEILKQRLSCIPIHIQDLEVPLNNYIVEVDAENLTDTVQYVTTEDFKIKNVTTDEYLSEKDNKAIFPPSALTGYYIDFARLRPKLSAELPGEKLKFTAEMTISKAKTNSMFNVVSTCSYGFTIDEDLQDKEIAKRMQGWKDDGMSKADMEMEAKNWRLLEGQRYVKKDSYDFIVESVGVFENTDIVKKACVILIQRLEAVKTMIDTDSLIIKSSETTIDNCFDVVLQDEDYTIGKVIEIMLYNKFYEELKKLSYCGFKKMHPHDSDSIIRLGYKENVEKSTIKQNLELAIADAVAVYKTIYDKF